MQLLSASEDSTVSVWKLPTDVDSNKVIMLSSVLAMYLDSVK